MLLVEGNFTQHIWPHNVGCLSYQASSVLYCPSASSYPHGKVQPYSLSLHKCSFCCLYFPHSLLPGHNLDQVQLSYVLVNVCVSVFNLLINFNYCFFGFFLLPYYLIIPKMQIDFYL